MLGLMYESQRGSLGIDYSGRKVAIKICPTGINTQRLRRGLAQWPEAIWRRGELVAQFAGKTVLVGVDDLDVFKGLELKLRAFEALLEAHPELRSKAVALQANSLSAERQQLSALEAERRAALRELESALTSEMVRLDDRAKEEKLKQVASMEKAYQASGGRGDGRGEGEKLGGT